MDSKASGPSKSCDIAPSHPPITSDDKNSATLTIRNTTVGKIIACALCPDPANSPKGHGAVICGVPATVPGTDLLDGDTGPVRCKRATVGLTLMNFTIRDYLKRRTRIFFGTAIIGWLLCAGSMFFMSASTNCRPQCGNRPPPPTVFLGFPIFGFAVIGLMFFTKCPRCSGRLGHLAANTLVRGFLSKPINFCPYCGVNIDEPYQKP